MIKLSLQKNDPAVAAGIKIHKTPAAQVLPHLAALFALKELFN